MQTSVSAALGADVDILHLSGHAVTDGTGSPP